MRVSQLLSVTLLAASTQGLSIPKFCSGPLGFRNPANYCKHAARDAHNPAKHEEYVPGPLGIHNPANHRGHDKRYDPANHDEYVPGPLGIHNPANHRGHDKRYDPASHDEYVPGPLGIHNPANHRGHDKRDGEQGIHNPTYHIAVPVEEEEVAAPNHYNTFNPNPTTLASYNTQTHLLPALTPTSTPTPASPPSGELGTHQPAPMHNPALPAHLQGRAEKMIGVHKACHDANFTGSCATYSEPHGECHNYPYQHWKKYTSILPLPGQFCYFYEEGDCYGSKVELRFPGSNNLRGDKFDNKVKSWKCWKIGG